MTYLQIVGKSALRTRAACVDFLKTHSRYWTMHSWNQASSYAHNIKIGRLQGLSADDRSRCYDGLQCDEAFEDFREVLESFHDLHPCWSIGGNGRSGGYLVLYQRARGDDGKLHCYPGRGLDMGEDFGDWDLNSIRSRAAEVRAFDEACEQAVGAYVDFCRHHKFVEKTYMTPKSYIAAVAEEGGA